MDAPTPAIPEPTPPPGPAPAIPPAPAPRLWRGESAPAPGGRRRRRAWPGWLALAAVIVAGGFLLSWFRPAPAPEFVPAWALGSSPRPLRLPTVAQGEPDRRAFATPGRNAFSASAAIPDAVDLRAALDTRTPGRTRVVYLCARASCDPANRDAVRILADDTYGYDDRQAGWLTLREILAALARGASASDSGPLLLILDLHPVAVDPRVGLEAGDLAQAIQGEITRFPSFPGLILTSCAPGEVPLASEALGRSAFSFYIEEGLRGWADAPERDGRVTVAELARFVRERVGRWAALARGARQTPTLFAGSGAAPADDVALVVLPRGRRLPRMALRAPKELPAYPAWLRDGWRFRDALRKAGADRDAPRVYAQVVTALRTADLDWRGGGDEARLRSILADALVEFRARLGPARALDAPRAVSLAREEAGGRSADAAVAKALETLIAERPAPEPGKKPAEVEATALRAIAGFYASAAGAKASDFDLARAAFRIAAEAREPDRDALAFLDRLLRTRQPRPLYAETDALRRVAALPESAWRPATVRLALDVARRGELAASRPASLTWVRPLLDAAGATRHEGETALSERGFASLDEADRLLRRAGSALAEALLAAETVESARRLTDEALDRLPAALDHLDAAPELESAWFEAAAQARATVAELAVAPPPDVAGARERVVMIERRAEGLEAALDALRRPFSAERIAKLVAPEAMPTPERYNALAALLDTPFPDAAQRVALWSALLSVDRRLNERVLRLDASGAPDAAPAPVVDPPADRARSRLELRARGSAELLALAGLAPDELKPLRRSPDRLALAWARLPARLGEATDPLTADRIGRLYPAFAPASRLDAIETNPTRRLRLAELRAWRIWTAARFASRASDLDGSPFESAAAEDYRLGDDPPPPAVAFAVDPTVPALDPSHPVATVPLRARLTGKAGDAEDVARVDVLLPDPEWLEVRRGSPWPAARSPIPATEPSPPRFELRLSAGEATTVPLEVALRPEPESGEAPRPPVPLGFLVRSRLPDGRSTHARVRLDVVPASRRLRVALSTDPAKPTAPVAELRLRPVEGLPGYYLYVENPTEADRAVLVQLRDGAAIVPGCEAAVTVKARGVQKVAFGAPSAKPEADVFPVRGPLRVRVLDAADPTKVLAEWSPPLAVAQGRDFLRVVEARYEPAGPGDDAKARLRVRLRAVGPIVGPPCIVALALTPDRAPGLVNAGEGTFRAAIAAEGDEATLFAEGLRFDERDDETGHVDVSVDGVERAFVFRATFAARGEPTTLRLDDRPAIRLVAPRAAFAGAPFEVGLALDNPPPGGRIEVELGRRAGGAFRADARRDLLAEKDAIAINPRGENGAIRFRATVRDPEVAFDVGQIRGRRTLRARLLDAEAAADAEGVDEDEQPVVIDDRAPAGVRLVDVPKFAKKGSTLVLRAVRGAGGADVQKVVMFVGRPVDGKVPPNAAPIEAKPTDFGRTSWGARMPIPADRAGPMDVSVQFVSVVGQSAFDTATVQVVDEVPVEPGAIRGQVVEGTRPQADLDLILFDAKGVERDRAKTDRDGRFEFADVPAGAYRVLCVKPTPPTRGLSEAVVAPGKPAEVTVEMLRTR